MKIHYSHIAQIAETNGPLLKASDLTQAGFSFKQIRRLVEKGILEKLDRGIYRFSAQPYDERLEIAKRIPSGVFCMYSACHLHGLSDFVPSEQHLAIPKKSRYVLPEYPPVKLYYWEQAAHDLGVMDFQLPEGILRVYDPEKTVCDMFRLRSKAGLDIVKEVLKSYLQRPDRDLAKLHSYARQLRVEKVLNEFLMILI